MLPVVSEPQPSALTPALEASVVVPVRNGARTLGRCLNAVLASEGIGEFEVIVVDDGSTDGSTEIASGFPCRLIRCEEGRGPAAARNRGAGEARSSRLVFVDADVFVRPESLARLLAALDSAPAAFGSYDPEPVNENFSTVFYHALSCRSIRDTSEKTPVFYSYCAAIRRDLFLELGGFDTNFARATFEDVELGFRLAERGLFSTHLRDVQVAHAVHYSLLGLARAYYRKSWDLAWLLLSCRSMTFGDQGWTHRKNWAVWASAWGTLSFGPLALWVDPLWALPWMLAVSGFLATSAELYRSMARRRWLYGPLGMLGYLGIHCVATMAMLAALFDWVRGGGRRRRPSKRRTAYRQPIDEPSGPDLEGGRP